MIDIKDWYDAIESEPWNLLRIGVFADWLDERNDPRGGAARLLYEKKKVPLRKSDAEFGYDRYWVSTYRWNLGGCVSHHRSDGTVDSVWYDAAKKLQHAHIEEVRGVRFRYLIESWPLLNLAKQQEIWDRLNEGSLIEDVESPVESTVGR